MSTTETSNVIAIVEAAPAADAAPAVEAVVTEATEKPSFYQRVKKSCKEDAVDLRDGAKALFDKTKKGAIALKDGIVDASSAIVEGTAYALRSAKAVSAAARDLALTDLDRELLAGTGLKEDAKTLDDLSVAQIEHLRDSLREKYYGDRFARKGVDVTVLARYNFIRITYFGRNPAEEALQTA